MELFNLKLSKMKTNYTVFNFLGSANNTDNIDSAKNYFANNLSATKLIDNKTGKILELRDHERVGFISSGIRFMGNINIYECSDSGKLITNLGELKEKAINRIKKITKNRNDETKYIFIFEADNLINYGELSRILAGSRSVVTKKRMPKKHEKKVNGLRQAIHKWYNSLS